MLSLKLYSLLLLSSFIIAKKHQLIINPDDLLLPNNNNNDSNNNNNNGINNGINNGNNNNNGFPNNNMNNGINTTFPININNNGNIGFPNNNTIIIGSNNPNDLINNNGGNNIQTVIFPPSNQSNLFPITFYPTNTIHTVIATYTSNNGQTSYLPIPTVTYTQTQILAHTTTISLPPLTSIQTQTEITTILSTQTQLQTQLITLPPSTTTTTITATTIQLQTQTQTITLPAKTTTVIQTNTVTSVTVQLQTQTISLPPSTVTSTQIQTNTFISLQVSTQLVKPPTITNTIYQPVLSTVTVVVRPPQVTYLPIITQNNNEFKFQPEYNPLNICYINGNFNIPCKGKCPPCWISTNNRFSCYKKVNSQCNPGFKDMTSLIPKITSNNIKNKSCFINGNKNLPCKSGANCPPCWNVNYLDQTFQCFNTINGSCNQIDDAVQLVSGGSLINNILPTIPPTVIDNPINILEKGCYINGDIKFSCKGNYCPSCWEYDNNLSIYKCYDFQSNFKCTNNQSNLFSQMQYSKRSFYLNKTCYLNGNSELPCFGEKCPKCWKFNYSSKSISCFNLPSIQCSKSSGMLDISSFIVTPAASTPIINSTSLLNSTNIDAVISNLNQNQASIATPIIPIISTIINNSNKPNNNLITNAIPSSTIKPSINTLIAPIIQPTSGINNNTNISLLPGVNDANINNILNDNSSNNNNLPDGATNNDLDSIISDENGAGNNILPLDSTLEAKVSMIQN